MWMNARMLEHAFEPRHLQIGQLCHNRSVLQGLQIAAKCGGRMGLSMNQFQLIFLVVLFIMFGSLTIPVRSRTLQDVSMYEQHEQWMVRYGRLYKDNIEKEKRFKIFEENAARIASINAADKPYKLGINQFADLTNEEFRALLMNRLEQGQMAISAKATSFKYENVAAVPPAIDWRQKGAVTPVKDLSRCGGSWAFSAVAAVEGITEITTGKLINLSEQQLFDCDTKTNGTVVGAFEYIIQNHGITTETNYPLSTTCGTCDTKKAADHAAKIEGQEEVPADSEAALTKAVANQPVSARVDAGGIEFQFYSSGIFTGDCGTEVNWYVTIVGYGAGDEGVKYWLVKNFWGTAWGEGGFIRMERDIEAKEGLCGIAMEASYPTV